MPKKKYYAPGVDQINQLVETPASRERTERLRFIVTVAITAVSAVAAIIAAIAAVLVYFGS